MPKTEAIAKRDYLPYFKKGEKITVVPVLYEEDTLIRNSLKVLCDKKGVQLRHFNEAMEFPHEIFKKYRSGEYVSKEAFPALYAPKGSYKDSYIITADGREYPSTILNSIPYQDIFEKI